MKSRTSFFNFSIFKKDLTRFAPVWALYSIVLVMMYLMNPYGAEESEYMAQAVARSIPNMALGAFVYALVCAMVLFGDLFVPRMCNALHAMPLRREGWFLTHTAAGLLFGLIPHALAALVLTIHLGEYAYLAGYWLGGVMLEYLFFFGLAELAALCAGNRLGMIAVYGIVNFGAIFVWALLNALYVPLLPGVKLMESAVENLFPLYLLMEQSPILVEVSYGAGERTGVEITMGSWSIFWILAGVGVLLGALAVLLYRKRHLERAADFLSVKPLAPVFLLIATLGSGLLWYLLVQLFGVGIPGRMFFYVGMALGFFVGLMLLERSTRVFRMKTVAAFAVLLLIVSGSLAVTKLDPMNITGRVPMDDQIESVQIDERIYENTRHITDSAEIAEITRLHEQLCQEALPGSDPFGYGTGADYTVPLQRVELHYQLTSGRELCRVYRVPVDTALAEQVQKIVFSWQNRLGTDNLEEFVSWIDLAEIQLWDEVSGYYGERIPRDQLLPVMEAYVEDVEADRIPQGAREFTSENAFGISLELVVPGTGRRYHSFDIPMTATSTIQVIQSLTGWEPGVG